MATFSTNQSQVIKFHNIIPPIKNIFHRIGYPKNFAELDGEHSVIFDEMLKTANNLIKPIGIFRIFKIKKCNEMQVLLQDIDFIIKSRNVAKLLRSSELLVFFMVTIGSNLEQYSANLISKGEITKGFVLDGIGSEIVDATADKLHRVVINELAEKHGYKITPRFSPGFGDWPVSVQKDLIDLCDGKSIGISLNEKYLMTPQKSVSAVLGLVKFRSEFC